MLVILLLGTALAACSSNTVTSSTNTATTALTESAASETADVTQSTETQSAPGEPPDGEMGSPPGGGGGTVDTGTGAYTLADGEALNGGAYTSTNADENASVRKARLRLHWTVLRWKRLMAQLLATMPAVSTV